MRMPASGTVPVRLPPQQSVLYDQGRTSTPMARSRSSIDRMQAGIILCGLYIFFSLAGNIAATGGLAKLLGDKLDMPAFVENDVNLGTLGEYVLGAGQGIDNVVGIFVGTVAVARYLGDGRLVE